MQEIPLTENSRSRIYLQFCTYGNPPFAVGNVLSGLSCLQFTSLQARDADLPASPAGLLGRFAPSGFALASRSHLARFALARFALRAHENFRKKSVSQSTQNALKLVKMQKKFLPLLTHYALCA